MLRHIGSFLVKILNLYDVQIVQRQKTIVLFSYKINALFCHVSYRYKGGGGHQIHSGTLFKRKKGLKTMKNCIKLM